MKKQLKGILFLVFAIQLISCKEKSNSFKNNDAENISGTESISDCDEFLIHYEEYVDDVVLLMKKMKNNPDDLSYLTDYTNMQLKLADWAEKSKQCESDQEFAMKLVKINLKLSVIN